MRTSLTRLPDANYPAFVANLLEICRANLLLYKIPEDGHKKAENLQEKTN
jgi:hypothetical protein